MMPHTVRVTRCELRVARWFNLTRNALRGTRNTHFGSVLCQTVTRLVCAARIDCAGRGSPAESSEIPLLVTRIWLRVAGGALRVRGFYPNAKRETRNS
jgi:hypothetical protein